MADDILTLIADGIAAERDRQALLAEHDRLRWLYRKPRGTKKCKCGRTISANKSTCLACMPQEEVPHGA